MNKVHHSHNRFHLGDNLIHVHFLRNLAVMYPDHQFVHYVEPCHLAQLEEMIDVPNVHLFPLTELAPAPSSARDVWKNADGYWENHIHRNSWSNFYVEWFHKLASEMGMHSPIQNADDLLLDHPALLKNNEFSQPWDFMIVNSQPSSGQLTAYDSLAYMDELISSLAYAGHNVLTTQLSESRKLNSGGRGAISWTGCCKLSVSGIGQASLWAKHVIAVSTGPSWTCLNAFRPRNQGVKLVMLEKERLDLPGVTQVQNIEEVMDFARLRNWI